MTPTTLLLILTLFVVSSVAVRKQVEYAYYENGNCKGDPYYTEAAARPGGCSGNIPSLSYALTDDNHIRVCAYKGSSQCVGVNPICKKYSNGQCLSYGDYSTKIFAGASSHLTVGVVVLVGLVVALFL